MQIPLKAFAVAAVGVFKHSHLALAVATHQRERVFDRQAVKRDGGQFCDAVFGDVAPGFGLDDLAVDQKIAFGVGVINLAAVDTHLIQATDARRLDLVNDFELRQALGQGLADGGFLRASSRSQTHQGDNAD